MTEEYVTTQLCNERRLSNTQTVKTLSEAIDRIEAAQKEVSREQRRINDRFSKDLTDLKIEFSKATTKLAILVSILSAVGSALLSRLLS